MKIYLQKDVRTLYSFIISLMLMVPVYIVFFDLSFGIERNVTLMFIMVCFFLLFVIDMLINRIKMNWRVVGMVVILLIWYVRSLGTIRQSEYSFIQFGFYCLLPALLVCQDLETEKIWRFIIYLSFPLVYALEDMIETTNVYLNQADMYYVYSFVPCISAAACHFIFSKQKKNLVIKIGYILNLYYLVRTSLVAVRGFWFVILIFIVSTVLYFLREKNSKSVYYLWLVIGLILMIVVLFYLEEILSVIIPFLQNVVSVDVGILIKIQKLLDAGDFSNGRVEIWIQCLELIRYNPVIGNGMESTAVLTGNLIKYPHNFIIQMLVDGGFVFASVPLYYTVKGIYFFVIGKIKDKNEFQFAFFLTVISFPISILSGDMWKSSSLWFTIFFYIKILLKKQNENES